MESLPYIKWFEELQLDDVAVVGGKNASLGGYAGAEYFLRAEGD